MISRFQENRAYLSLRKLHESRVNREVVNAGILGIYTGDRHNNFSNFCDRSVSCFGIVFKDGTILYKTDEICSACLHLGYQFASGSIEPEHGEICCVTSGTKDYKLYKDKEYRLRFCDWFINRSPWSDIIINKDAEYADEYGIILNAYSPKELLVGATIAQRALWENTHILETMIRLVDSGMNEDAAFFLAHSCYVNASGVIRRSISEYHVALDGNELSKSRLINFCKHDLSRFEKVNYSDAHDFDYKINSSFGIFKYKDELNLFYGNLNEFNINNILKAINKKAKKKEVYINNVFHKTLKLENKEELFGNGILKALSDKINNLIAA